MKFLKKLSRFFRNISRKSNVLPNPVHRDESTVKFVMCDDHFSTKNNTVNQAAFKPSKKTGNISIYRTKALCREWIFGIGRKYVTALRPDKLPVLAAARLRAGFYYDQNLRFDPNGEPHYRHANVDGWQADPALQREIRILLARQAELLLPDLPGANPNCS